MNSVLKNDRNVSPVAISRQRETMPLGSLRTRYESHVRTGISRFEYGDLEQYFWSPRPLDGWGKVILELRAQQVIIQESEGDEDFIPPSAQSLRSAISFARMMGQHGEVTPTRTVPNGDGGIVFEQSGQCGKVLVEFYEDGSGELLVLDENRVVSRHLIE